MANGFLLNETARPQIRAERETMRHLSNSLATAPPIYARKGRVFFATPQARPRLRADWSQPVGNLFAPRASLRPGFPDPVTFRLAQRAVQFRRLEIRHR
jgi:hypothetical protein